LGKVSKSADRGAEFVNLSAVANEHWAVKNRTSMKRSRKIISAILFTSAVSILPSGCGTPVATTPRGGEAAFKAVLPTIEANCVHCHGEQRLPTMFALTSTRELGSLIGPGKLIVPGKPEQSRFFKVVTFSDNEEGAMPPTGHAIGKRHIEALRKWIEAGAPVPAQPHPMKPRGEAPRSR
jgi:mono/diheme cytochrome c family protein